MNHLHTQATCGAHAHNTERLREVGGGGGGGHVNR